MPTGRGIRASHRQAGASGNRRTNPTHTNSAINLTLGASAIPYVFMTPPDSPSAGEIAKYVFGFDFNKDAPRIFQTSGIYKESSMSFMAAASTDLGKFDRTGRKLLVYHGTADPGVFLERYD